MDEYWWSSRETCIDLLGSGLRSNSLPRNAPESFRSLRPWIHQGWEMVLLTAELTRTNSPLRLKGTQFFASKYLQNCEEALKAWGWSPVQLQEALDHTRRVAVAHDRAAWLARHRTFPGVVQRLNCLAAEKVDLVILTTKGEAFTDELLRSLNLTPQQLYGHESGSKRDVLLHLAAEHSLLGFVEDRRKTLENILSTPKLSSLPCYLASWGYLKPQDKQNLPIGIHILEPEDLAAPLARWP